MNRENIRKWFIPLFALLLVIIVPFSLFFYYDEKNKTDQSAENNDNIEIKIGILRTDNSRKSEDIYNSFIGTCDELAQEESVNIEYMYLCSIESDDKAKAYALKLADSDCDAILTIDEQASLLMYETGTNIPVVFAGVTDPEADGLVASNSEPGGIMTGVSDYTPCFEQINLICRLYPSCRTVAFIYDENNENSIIQLNIAKYQAEELSLTLNEYPVSDFAKLESVLEKASENNEAVYLPDDTEIANNLEQICDFFNERKIPVIGGTEAMVWDGCLATYIIDYNSLGEKAAVMLLDIIVNGKNPSAVPVAYTTECELCFNWVTASEIDCRPSGIMLLYAMGN